MAEEDDNISSSYPSIEPSHFDLIIIGTGLPESLIAAAASAVGKTVLHLDSNSFYGTHFSSLPLHDFTSFLQHQSQQQSSPLPSSTTPGDGNIDGEGDKNYLAVNLEPSLLYFDIEITSHASPEDLEPSRKFSLDLSGPRVLFCADQAVDLMLRSGASHHVEFKSVDKSLIYRKDDGKLVDVPDSRAEIFKTRSLDFRERRRLMSFFKLVQQHFESTTAAEMKAENMAEEEEEKSRISDEDLECSFVDFLDKEGLTPNIKEIILYAIAMADYDQDSLQLCKAPIKTKDGIKSLILYHSSVGRFPNALGALIYPIYGQGELPQAFCRCAAVKGALYVLRMPVTSLLLDKESKRYGGVRLASGQELFGHHLVMGPSFVVPSPSVLVPMPHVQQESSERSNLREVKELVARAVCIIRGSIKSGPPNLLVVFPPRSLYLDQVASVRVLQLGSGLAVCPLGLSVLYLSALCDDAVQGKESLRAALRALLSCSTSESHEKLVSEQSESVDESNPTLLWSSMYTQKLMKGSSEAIILCPMPDGNLDYRNILESTVELFQKMYPEEEFMPESRTPEDTENDNSE